jgi:hypothetical protein
MRLEADTIAGKAVTAPEIRRARGPAAAAVGVDGGIADFVAALPQFKSMLLCRRVWKQELPRRIIIGLPVAIRVIGPISVVVVQAFAAIEAALANCSCFERASDGAR